MVEPNPFEKYARQNGKLPQVGVKINNIWNHHTKNELIACHNEKPNNSRWKIPINFCFQICNWEASPGLYPQNSAPKTEGLRMSSFIISWIVIKTNMAKVLPCRRAKTLIPDPRWTPATAVTISTLVPLATINNRNYHDYHYLALNLVSSIIPNLVGTIAWGTRGVDSWSHTHTTCR